MNDNDDDWTIEEIVELNMADERERARRNELIRTKIRAQYHDRKEHDMATIDLVWT